MTPSTDTDAMRYINMFGNSPFNKTIDASDFLNFLYGETADESLIRRVATEWFDVYEEAECAACGFETPCIEIDDALTCMLCKTSVLRTFTVTFTFTITVKAKDRDEAENIAGDAVSASVDESSTVEDNYDLEIASVDEQY